jgi:hypothetical protein
LDDCSSFDDDDGNCNLRLSVFCLTIPMPSFSPCSTLSNTPLTLVGRGAARLELLNDSNPADFFDLVVDVNLAEENFKFPLLL